MDDYVCEQFQIVSNWISDELGSDGNYQIEDEHKLNVYCVNNECDGDLDIINAGCLFLFEKLFGSYGFFNNHNRINIVEYILIWLSYMLSLKSHDNIVNLEEFYDQYINHGNEYINSINCDDYNTSYVNLIDKKLDLMNMDIKDISKFYDAFKSLCDIYSEFDGKTSNCTKCSDEAQEFAKKYDDLNENYNNTKGSPYNKILSTLSNDYNNFKNKCNGAQSIKFPTLPTYSRRSVIKKTIISIVFIFVAVSIFLGIAYKYSLFGRRKRALKQYLREKIKNIKKRMNHSYMIQERDYFRNSNNG
ncbi:BIR protein [Plasmodium berghei]|uniref:BIR protein n=2 Tax=Plasmodium berghei TaxID=5821 RepID=A0A509AHX8_PLABA|nr:BIR protein [Plasmodium berghei ANKA]CXH20685.1 BIR protein [Plasmodium berghei]SBW38176.1 BIR protein [Plasmodium berghei]SCL82721.1 BIR protein [Plasmodium berghei]SCL82981.1 BIR protein [Plasmodium berghei]VUC54216.1 BIR protein [Plasmodium berghei ANKA]|eukprot:XP_034420054.1 BIR protein [Plasmodium berghei ANKA]